METTNNNMYMKQMKTSFLHLLHDIIIHGIQSTDLGTI